MNNDYKEFFKSKRGALVMALFAAVLFSRISTVQGQVLVPFTQRTVPTNIKIKGDFAMTGNASLTLVSYGDQTQNGNNNMRYVDVDNDPTTFNSSAANLDFSLENGADPECSEIIWAGLYWSGRASDGSESPTVFDVTKNMPTGATTPVSR